MAGPQIEIRSAGADEMSQTVACIVAAFITDPLGRFAWPSPHQYLEAMPLATGAFAGASFERGTADVTADFCGAGLWLPPGTHPDSEALEKTFRDTAKPEHLDDLRRRVREAVRSRPVSLGRTMTAGSSPPSKPLQRVGLVMVGSTSRPPAPGAGHRVRWAARAEGSR